MALSFEGFSFIYGEDKTALPAVKNINFSLNQGDVLILAGPSGSGKSTLSYAMNGIIPWRLKGFMKGDVKIHGKSIWNYNFTELSKLVGLVKQNPLEQMTTFTVKDELAFGLENLKIDKDIIEKKVEEISEFMGISQILNRDIEQLSGGQKQLTILSSFLVMNPKILILDEPIAFLDQQSESLLLTQLKKLKESESFKTTLIIIEHRLSRVMDIADKIIVLDDIGEIRLKGNLSEILINNYSPLKSCNVRLPWIIDLFNDFKDISPDHRNARNPTNFNELLEIQQNLSKEKLLKLRDLLIEKEIMPKALEKFESFEDIIEFQDLYIESLKNKHNNREEQISDEESNIDILETKNVDFIYPNSGIKALNNLSIKIQEGDFIGLVGPNGSGKTTLLYLLANLYQPTSGSIFYYNRDIRGIGSFEYAKQIGFIFQNPENMIFNSTIKDEILYGPKNFGMLEFIPEDYLVKLIRVIGKEKSSKNPFKLSWGQKRRLNLSSIFVYSPEIILLDEPFIGQDQRTIDSLVETLYLENKRGKTIIISSHDYHLLLKYTKRILELNKDGTVRDFDNKDNYFNKHRNLGPTLLLDSIDEMLREGD
ncbi:MAG: ATP-binding cassette domain-containing protein [Candidatus Lokiarchaeota archaeon]|nr:ATP-binding cassette domain-containing protein [Candidatus Lokiarchaeota archaeon]